MSCKCPSCRPTWKKILLCEACGKTTKIITTVIIFLGLLVTIVILLWLLLRYQEPRFTLQDVTKYTFNVSINPSFVTSIFQVTLSSFNPNDYVDIYFDSLKVHAAYHGQQITESTGLPKTYERRNEHHVWSTYLYGKVMPIAPDNALTMSDVGKDNEVVEVTIRIHARLRYRLRGGLKTRHHITVDCPAYITFGTPGNGTSMGDKVIKYQIMQSCH